MPLCVKPAVLDRRATLAGSDAQMVQAAGGAFSRSITTVKLATKAATAPMAASTGAPIAPIAAIASGTSINVLPLSSLMMTRRTLPSWMSSLTFSTRSWLCILISSKILFSIASARAMIAPARLPLTCERDNGNLHGERGDRHGDQTLLLDRSALRHGGPSREAR